MVSSLCWVGMLLESLFGAAPFAASRGVASKATRRRGRMARAIILILLGDLPVNPGILRLRKSACQRVVQSFMASTRTRNLLHPAPVLGLRHSVTQEVELRMKKGGYWL